METNDPPGQYSRNAAKQQPLHVSTRHLMDPLNYRRDGRMRSGFGRFVQRAAPVVGRTVLQVGRGIVDGIPGVSQVVNTLMPQAPHSVAGAVTRVMVGWSTVVLVAMAALLKVTGQIDSLTLVQLIVAFMGM